MQNQYDVFRKYVYSELEYPSLTYLNTSIIYMTFVLSLQHSGLS
jgi:hypothetical protein